MFYVKICAKEMLAFVFTVCLLTSLIEGCPSGWVQDQGMCYYFSDVIASSWAEASSYCQAFGYKLAELNNQVALNFITGMLTKNHNSTRYFIGGSDIFVEGEWIWSTSHLTISQHNWEPNEPNNVNEEDCLSINSDGKWNDVPCNLKLKFICQTEDASVEVIGK